MGGREGGAVRILMATPRFWPDTGGTELHVAEVSRRLAAAGDEVTVLTTDVTGSRPAEEERDGYRIVRVPAYPRERDYYVAPLVPSRVISLRPELVHVQEWVVGTQAKVCVVFEGRDGAGKGGVIKRITERVSPRVFRVVALPAPTDRERSQVIRADVLEGSLVRATDRRPGHQQNTGVDRPTEFCRRFQIQL